MAQESSIINCKACGRTKKRLLSGYYPNKKDKRWIDENGEEFNGKTCPSCHRENVRKNKQMRKALK